MRDFQTFLREKEEEEMANAVEEKKAKIIAIFTEGEPVTVETITTKAEELEMDKEELENEVYGILFDMLNVEEEPAPEEEGEVTPEDVPEGNEEYSEEM